MSVVGRATRIVCALSLGLLSLGSAVPEPRFQAKTLSKSFELRTGIDQLPETVDFPFTNGGEKVLNVTVVKVSCGCLERPVLTAESLEPGKEGILTIKLDAARAAKRTSHDVMLQTNDPVAPYVHVKVSIRWLEPVEIRPGEAIDLGRVSRNTEVAKTITIIQNFGDVPLEVLDASVSEVDFDGKMRLGQDVAKRVAYYDLRLRSDAPPGIIQGVATFRTNLPDRQTMAVRLSGILVGDLDVSPWQIDLGLVPQGEIRTREAFIRPTGQHRVAKVLSHEEGLEAVLDSDREVPVIKLKYHSNSADGPISAHIELISTSGEKTVIPVIGEHVPAITPGSLRAHTAVTADAE